MNPEDRFKFSSLEDAAHVCRQMAREIEGHHGMLAGLQVITLALMATHQDHRAMQLATTTYLEKMIGTMPAGALTDEHRETAREFVEQLQRIRPFQPPAVMSAGAPPHGK